MLGTVASLDRVNGVASIYLDGSTTAIGCRYFGDPPPPLSRVDVDNPVPGTYVCRGPQVDSRIILHDDFLAADSGTGYGDTNWNFFTFSGGTAAQGALAGTAGTVLINSSTTTGQYALLYKDSGSLTIPAAPGALWLSGNVATNDVGGVTNDIFYNFALYDTGNIFAGTGNGVSIYGYIGTTALRNTLAGVTHDVTLPFAVVGGQTFFTLDLVSTATFTAAWYNGVGPFVNTVGIPTAAALTPEFGPDPLSAHACQMAADWVHLERVASVQDPTKPPFVTGH